MTSFMIEKEKAEAEARLSDLWDTMRIVSKNLQYAQQTLQGQLKEGFVPSPSLLSNVASMAQRMMFTAESIERESKTVKVMSNTLKLMEAV